MTITINILDFNYIKQTRNYHSVFRLFEKDEGFELTEALEIHFMGTTETPDQVERKAGKSMGGHTGELVISFRRDIWIKNDSYRQISLKQGQKRCL